MGRLGRATCTIHLISAQTSQEGIECTTGKKWLRAYWSQYIYCGKDQEESSNGFLGSRGNIMGI